jgi:hypothetical protein
MQKLLKRNSFWEPGIITLATVILIWFNLTLTVIVTFTLVSANWLKMGRRDKALWNSLFGVFILVMLQFVNYGAALVQAYDPFWNIWSYEIGVVIVVLSSIYLVFSTLRNAKRFEEGGLEREQLKWWITPAIGLTLFLAFLGLNAGLNAVAKFAGYARFPTIYDLIVDYTNTHAQGLENGLFQPHDVDGSWQWLGVKTDVQDPYPNDADWLKAENPAVDARFWRMGDGYCDWNTTNCRIDINQYIRHQSTLVTQADIAFLGRSKSDYDEQPFKVELSPIAGSVFQTMDCFSYGGGLNTCYLVLGFKHVITTLNFTTNAPPKFIADVMNQMIPKIGQRIIRYEEASH